MAFTFPADGQIILASHVNQILNAWTGVASAGVPLELVTVSSDTKPAATIKNLGTGGGLKVLSSAGATLLLVTDSGVSLSYGAGTVASPALSLNGDTDTGWYQSAADQWAFAVAGARKIVLQAGKASFQQTVAAELGSLGAGSTPAFSSTVTWTDAPTAYVHGDHVVTDTASAAGSILLRYKVGAAGLEADKFVLTKAGALTLAGALTAGGDIKGVNLTFRGNSLEEYLTNASTEIAINYAGYNAGATQFRDLAIYDGKNARKFRVVGSTGVTEIAGGATVNGSPSGYGGGEVQFSNGGASLSAAISTLSTSVPALLFDHRATGNTGEWAFRNGTNAGTERFRIKGDGLLFVCNVVSAPGGNPVGGGYLFVDAGALKYRGSSGTVTTIAAA